MDFRKDLCMQLGNLLLSNIELNSQCETLLASNAEQKEAIKRQTGELEALKSAAPAAQGECRPSRKKAG